MNRSRRLNWPILSAISIVLMLAVIGMIWFIHAHRTAQGDGPTRREQLASETISSDSAVRSRAMHRLGDQGVAIRNHWETWAKAHASVLREMKHASPGDLNALEKVCHSLPRYPGDGSNSGISGVSHDDLYSSGIETFTWQPIELATVSFALSKPSAGIADLVKRQFEESHDIVISSSETAGPTTVYVWASGRVTVEQYVAEFAGHHMPSKARSIVVAELTPPYDFLK
jgi:hypothetical protein